MARVSEALEAENPFSGERHSLVDIEAWLRTIGGWLLVILGFFAASGIAKAVVGAVHANVGRVPFSGLFGGGGAVNPAQVAAAATAAATAPGGGGVNYGL